MPNGDELNGVRIANEVVPALRTDAEQEAAHQISVEVGEYHKRWIDRRKRSRPTALNLVRPPLAKGSTVPTAPRFVESSDIR